MRTDILSRNGSLWLIALPLLTGVLVFILFMLLAKEAGEKRWILRGFEILEGFLKEKPKGVNWYQRQYAYLKKRGAQEHYGKWLTPFSFLMLKIVLAFLGMFLGNFFWKIPGMLLGIVFYMLPDFLLKHLNQKDNERMLGDLKLVYHALEIQIRAGVYVTDALAECYGGVREKRLKQALLDMAGDIVMKADIGESLEKFQGKFENRYIDALCITIMQALESGQAVELLGDLAEQMKDMELNVLTRKKNALDRSFTLYQLGILACILAIVLYACVLQMFSAAVNL